MFSSQSAKIYFCFFFKYIILKNASMGNDTYKRFLENYKMNFFAEVFHNKILVASATGWVIAQVLKTLIHTFFSRQFVAERLVGGGGMPSSHSATVCALATATALQYGASSFEFAVSAVFALVVCSVQRINQPLPVFLGQKSLVHL